MVKTIENPKNKVRDMAFSVSQGRKSFLLRNEKWVYIQYNEDASAGIELSDMKNDPEQFTNLARNPKYSKTVARIKKKLPKKLTEVRHNDLRIDYNTP